MSMPELFFAVVDGYAIKTDEDEFYRLISEKGFSGLADEHHGKRFHFAVAGEDDPEICDVPCCNNRAVSFSIDDSGEVRVKTQLCSECVLVEDRIFDYGINDCACGCHPCMCGDL